MIRCAVLLTFAFSSFAHGSAAAACGHALRYPARVRSRDARPRNSRTQIG